MANIDFPSSPTNGQVYTFGSRTWQYNSTSGSWVSANPSTPGSDTQLIFNDAGSANSSASLIFNKSTNIMTVNGSIVINTSNTSGIVSNTVLSGTANTPFINAIMTSNSSANITMIKTNFVNTAAVGSGSLLIDLQTNGSSAFKVAYNGVTSPGSTLSMTSGHVIIQNGYNMQVNGSGGVSWNTEIVKYKITYTSSNTNSQVIDSNAIATYRSVHYILQAVSGTAYQTTMVSLIHDGTTPYISEYNNIATGASLMTLDTTIVGANLNLVAIPTNANTTFKMLKTLTTV